ncbi:uncharacterized protein LOC133825069 [Humulus lupulus]|uniref:uncharacterized protein LOC133825069 n=1 Tax=Humulus lupulus TaxID=3486 RepID=UPI002B401E0E|nr:uncharacterized protein LOC133825069 [Humulus lupulus]
MTEESLKVPDEGATKTVRDKYEHWQVANNKSLYYMLNSMVDTLKTKMGNVKTTYKIMVQLQDMFSAKSVQTQLHGANIDEENKVGLILNSLSPAFMSFTKNYVMNKLNYGLMQLVNELLTFESIVGGPSKGGEKKTTVASIDPSKAEANQASSPKTGNKRKDGQNNNPRCLVPQFLLS